jgi:hypothetical protein
MAFTLAQCETNLLLSFFDRGEASRVLSLSEERVQKILIRLIDDRNNLDPVAFSFQIANRVI